LILLMDKGGAKEYH